MIAKLGVHNIAFVVQKRQNDVQTKVQLKGDAFEMPIMSDIVMIFVMPSRYNKPSNCQKHSIHYFEYTMYAFTDVFM